MVKILQLSLLVLMSVTTSFGQTYDWPMWRHDYNRSASTPEQLADNLYLQWQVKYPARQPVWDDPLNQNLMQFDRIFEPVVAGNKVFIGFNDQDKVVALDLNTGKELWHFYADGPVRLPLAINKGRIYFTGDDGYCYCLNTTTGYLVWKRLLAPSENKLLGNKRLISMWPARGGIVIKDDIIYTAASIFPMMGTYIYALDARTGDIIWKNDGTGSNYILQPHRSPAFADVAPQGPFTISGDKLLVAGGRTVPAAFSLRTGEELYYHLAASGKTGGAFTFANNRVFFNHHRERMTYLYDSNTGNKILSDAGEYPVIEGNTFFFSGKRITISRLNPENRLETLLSLNVPARNDLIKAGNCLYAADSTGIRAVKLLPGNNHEVVWSFSSVKSIERLVASNGKLIAVTNEGTIMVFGDSPVARVTEQIRPDITVEIKQGGQDKLLQATSAREGYCLVLGTGDLNLLKGLLTGTSLNIIAFDKEPGRVLNLREYFDKAGINAERISIQLFEKKLPPLPKYFSSLTVISDLTYVNDGDKDDLRQIYESSRPYGGEILIRTNGKEHNQLMKTIAELQLPGAVAAEGKGYAMVTRPGPLEGASPWTHNYGNIANTVKSDDQLVKAPLGILWFGGPSNLDVLPRHGHGPGEQVIDGRLIIQGMSSISARDVYTGRVLWRRNFEKLLDDSWMVYWDESYDEENPLDTKYNQEHLPGSNSRGTNFIATKEYVYLIEGNKCNLIDIASGDIAKVFTTGDEKTRELGYIGVYGDLLILGNDFAEYTGMENDSIRIKDRRFTEYNLTASRELVVLNRFTGEKLWRIKARHGFIHNSVIAGDGFIFCLDKLPQYLETKLRRRGETSPEGSRLLYLDALTGKVVHEETKDIFGTWLGYSAEYKLLLQGTRPSRDMLNGEEGNRMIVYNAGTKEKVWDKPVKYSNPPIIHHDKIYSEGAGFLLLTGDQLTEKDPVTGEDLNWTFKREYGCGIVAASEYLLTFRSASAGFVNLESYEGTGSLGGWKAGCSTNLIAADGVLNSPDYTRTCQCPYQNQTSLALINMPWMTYWTNSNYKWNGKTIRQLGLNFNAPGDRSADNKVLWLEYPFNSAGSPGIPIKIDTLGFSKIRKEPINIESENTPWVSSSAIGGIRSLEIGLSSDRKAPESSYTVKLYFSELENKMQGERIFDISIQGMKVADNFDIAAEAGKPDREVVKTFYGVKAGNTLKVDLAPEKGNTLISGIEIVLDALAVQ
jgi:outer membrane protein assembly factor BamB